MEHLIEIYFDDLRPAKQQELLEAAEIDSPQEANWDVFLLTLFSTGKADESADIKN